MYFHLLLVFVQALNCHMRSVVICMCLLLYGGVLAQDIQNEVVIDEIMADPSPSAGLPEVEFVELKNVANHPINLAGWKFSDASSTATISANFTLLPDSFVIICSNSSAQMLASFGRTLGVSNFPSLDNDGDLILLRSKEGYRVHAVDYRKNWYQNAVKSAGGWTLEMIDTNNPCSGANNWKASIHPNGGTPGTRNSINATNRDESSPGILRAFATDSMNVTIVFDEPLDSTAATVMQNYLVSNGIGSPRAVTAVGPLFNKAILHLSASLERNRVYTLTARRLTDCKGNEIGSKNVVKVGLPSKGENNEVVINEVLFNPKADGVDYVEIFNRDNSIIDIKDLYLANRDINGTLSSLGQLAIDSRLLFPGDYLVITENAAIVKRQYLSKDPDTFVETAMPSYPDNKGSVVLLNSAGRIIDELHYDEKWHFPLIENNEGVALECIDYNKITQDAGNWHSAATSAGYGTPGYQNSQFKTEGQFEGIVTINPEVFSPDNDGVDDVATINYQFDQPGYVCNITLFNANGAPVRFLVRNGLCGVKGYFRWDGLDEKHHRLNIGIYVIVAEVFNLKGKTRRFKKVIVLARKLG